MNFKDFDAKFPDAFRYSNRWHSEMFDALISQAGSTPAKAAGETSI